MRYEDALAYLEGLIRFGVKPDLEHFRLLCERAGNPQEKFKSVHVGGTNGKGSTTVMSSSILRAAGYHTGTYLSPHVHNVRERIQIDGSMIGETDFAALMGSMISDMEAVADSEGGRPTEFKAETLMAFLYFARENVDFACVEVGMGGRFDATNVLNPLVSVITNVSLDHTERLGDTVEKIALEKAEIIKPGRPVVTAADGPAWEIISRTGGERGAPIRRVGESREAQVAWRAGESGLLSIRTPKQAYSGLTLGLRGAFQYPNAACAVAAMEFVEDAGFPVGEEAIRRGLAQAYIPGRLEVLRRNPTLVIDGAHNPDAAARLAEAIKSEFQYRRLILVVGMLSTHSAEGFLSHVAPLADRIITTAPDWPLARPAEELASEAERFCQTVSAVTPIKSAVSAALAEAGEEDLVLVTGSFYTIGEVER
ncbi:MAG: folylpolyglutamate synthase/dihydrofolate synthase family protein [Armatimonadota bacterium]|nr:folylpolyglutamate synthase/dihydrofolate synthase family protein [Armatimonadota bacterium]